MHILFVYYVFSFWYYTCDLVYLIALIFCYSDYINNYTLQYMWLKKKAVRLVWGKLRLLGRVSLNLKAMINDHIQKTIPSGAELTMLLIVCAR